MSDVDNKKGTDAAHYITASVHCRNYNKSQAQMSMEEE